VPGAPPGAPAPKADGGDKKKRVRSKRPLKEEEAAVSGAATPAEVENGVSQLSVDDKGAVDEVVAKKVRALNKKVSRTNMASQRQRGRELTVHSSKPSKTSRTAWPRARRWKRPSCKRSRMPIPSRQRLLRWAVTLDVACARREIKLDDLGSLSLEQ
jgi:hypothetical protein